MWHLKMNANRTGYQNNIVNRLKSIEVPRSVEFPNAYAPDARTYSGARKSLSPAISSAVSLLRERRMSREASGKGHLAGRVH
jgi:hypothetical protein